MNLQLSMEEDSKWKTYINQKGRNTEIERYHMEDYKNRMVPPRIEWYLKGRNPTNMEGY
jgi:hypothetical protein